jgi:hypothetical protein
MEENDPPLIGAHIHSIYEGLTFNSFLLQGQAVNVEVGVAGFNMIRRT